MGTRIKEWLYKGEASKNSRKPSSISLKIGYGLQLYARTFFIVFLIFRTIIACDSIGIQLISSAIISNKNMLYRPLQSNTETFGVLKKLRLILMEPDAVSTGGRRKCR